MSLRIAPLVISLTAMMMVSAKSVRAQVLPVAAGAVGGFIAGTIVTTGTVVFEARLGHYIYGLDDFVKLRPEILPMVLGPVAGAMIGAKSSATLRRVSIGAAVGLVGGAAIGSGVGTLMGTSSEARWAGGIIGGAAGMLAGSVIYGSRKPKSADGAAIPIASMSIKVPWGR